MSFNTKQLTKILGSSAFSFLAVAGGVGLYKSCIFTVQGGHQAIKFNKLSGIKETIFREGWHIKLPYFQIPYIYQTRSKPKNFRTQTPTKDLQNVGLEVRILYRPQVENLVELHRTLGPDFDDRVLTSIVQEVLKSIVAQSNASELLSRRQQISLQIKSTLQQRAKQFYIAVDDVSMTQLGFTKQFQAAIEAKQVAYQQAERAKFLVERAQQEKKSSIIKAQGEAKSAELIGKAMKDNSAFIELKRIQAVKQISETFKQMRGKAFLNSDMLFLNLAEQFSDTLTKKASA